MNSDEPVLKSCPWCGNQPKKDISIKDAKPVYSCCVTEYMSLERWNTRTEPVKSEPNRCKHGVVMPDCFECYPPVKDTHSSITAQPVKTELVELDVDSLTCFFMESHYSKMFANHMAKRICSKFAQPKRVSVEDIKNEIICEATINGCTCEGGYINNYDEIASAIHNKIYGSNSDA